MEHVKQAKGRRARLAEISRDYKQIPVRVGSQQMGAIEAVRKSLEATAKLVYERTPEGREQSIALTKLEEARMWAIKAISHRQGGDDED